MDNKNNTLTADILVLVNREILLIRRAKEPFMDKLVMPGGHVDEGDASFEAAAVRELEEETGVRATIEMMVLLIVLDAPGRDPRGHKETHVFLLSLREKPAVIAATDARSFLWRDIDSIRPDEIGFDHFLAIEKAKTR